MLCHSKIECKDKGLDDERSVQSREEAIKTATNLGIDEYKNAKEK